MDEKGFRTIDDFRGLSAAQGHRVEAPGPELQDRGAHSIADKCIGCDLCYIACWDGAHQCIHLDGHATPAAIEAASRAQYRDHADPQAGLGAGQQRPDAAATRIPRVDEDECVGCNLCWLVCPVEDCITWSASETGLPSRDAGNSDVRRLNVNTLIRNGTVVTARRHHARPIS